MIVIVWYRCSWIFNYLCNLCLSPLTLWVQTPFMTSCTRWRNYIEYMLQRYMNKCNCHGLKYLVLYYKGVIALILRNMVPHSISYWTRKLVWYDILLGTIFLNISAITHYYKTHDICIEEANVESSTYLNNFGCNSPFDNSFFPKINFTSSIQISWIL